MNYSDPRLRTVRHRYWQARDEVRDLKKRHRRAEEIARNSEFESDKRLVESLSWQLEQATLHAQALYRRLQEAKASR